MKQISIIFIFSFLILGNSFSQKFKPIVDSLEIEKFNEYVNSILELKMDVFFFDSIPGKYKVIYKTSCRSEEYLSSDSAYYSTFGKSFINDTTSFLVSVNSFDVTPDWSTQSFPCVFQNAPYICGEKPSELTVAESVTVSIENEITIDGFGIEKIYLDPSFYKNNSFGSLIYKACISFHKSKYLIFEYFWKTGIGSQTSIGSTETLFLERVE